MTTPYIKSAERREQLLQGACMLAEESHYRAIRRSHLAHQCCTADANVSRVLGSMDEVRTALIEYAIEHKRQAVIAQAVLDKHPAVSHLSAADRRTALDAAL